MECFTCAMAGEFNVRNPRGIFKIKFWFLKNNKNFLHLCTRTRTRTHALSIYRSRAYEATSRFSDSIMSGAEHVSSAMSLPKKKRRGWANETTLLANVATVTSRYTARREIYFSTANSPAFKLAIAERSASFRCANPTAINMSDTVHRSSSGTNHWRRRSRSPSTPQRQ